MKMNAIIVKKMIIVVAVTFFIFSKCQKLSGLIYILEWTTSNKEPFNYLGIGQEPFIRRNCSFQNCILTDDHSYFNNVLDFDALLFNACNLDGDVELPANRTEEQEYILVGLEPSAYCPLPTKFNDFFNLTWTYKLSSDILYPYLGIKNNRSELIGPRLDMQWMDVNDMAPTDKKIVSKLQRKSIAAAWVASNCDTKGRRLGFVNNLNTELSNYGHRVDYYGLCGQYQDCERFPEDINGDITKCSTKIKTDYYFYLAFENSCCEDYVSEKVLHGLKYFAVPIVYGGANYTRFMPDGIYLNALTLGIKGLAKEMNDIILKPQRYQDFFKWHGYYTFHQTADDEYHYAVCGLCAMLNNKTRREQRTVHSLIAEWWNCEGLPHSETLVIENGNSVTSSTV